MNSGAVERSRTWCPGVLICPVCGDALSDADGSFRCLRGHAFDRAREGYVHLLPAGHGQSRLTGDTRAMVAARRRFLARGYYESVSAAINRHGLAHLAGSFALAGDEALEYDREMPSEDILDLLRMTPNHWHLDDAALAGVAALDPVRVTISMRLLRFRRNGSS